MRPLVLTMHAFGPYRDEETVDFRQLEHRRLFVISGNTGAGKTTIFDAICFALYGTASGEDRAETRMLRSHFALDHQHTAVDFTFSIGARTYRVLRQMGHRKGTNKSETGAKIELYEIVGGEEKPLVDRFHVTDVQAKLEAMIGLTKDQFSQIVMLPQGEFRKLLTSDTDNKEHILRRIFRTDLYEKLEEHFQRKHREQKDAYREQAAHVELCMKQARETMPQREGSALAATFAQDVYNAQQVADGLTAEADHYAQQQQQAQLHKEQLAVELQQQEEALRQAMLRNGRFALLEQKRREAETLLAQQPAMEQVEQQLQWAQRAARLEPYREQARRAEHDYALRQSQWQHRQQTLERAGQVLTTAQQQYEREDARADARKDAQRQLQIWTDLVPAVQMLDAQRQRVEQLAAQEKACTAALAAAEQQWQTARQAKQTIAQQRQQLEQATAALPEQMEALDQLRQKARLLKELAELERQMDGWTQQQVKWKQERDKLQRQHDAMEQRWIEGQASLLAAHLHDGKPCPVCGSEAHPHKAAVQDDLPSRTALQEAKAQLQHAQEQVMAAQAQIAAAESGQDTHWQAAAPYGIERTGLAAQYKVIEAEGKQLRAQTDHLKQQHGSLVALRKEEGEQERRVEQLQQEKDRLQTQQQQLVVERSTAQAAYVRELERIPEAVRTPALLQQQIDAQQRHADELQQAWTNAQQQLQQAQTAVAAERAAVEQLAAQVKQAEQDVQMHRSRLEQLLAENGFASEAACAAAVLEHVAQQRLQQQLDTYKRSSSLVAEQIGELERELADAVPADTAALEQTLGQVRQAHEQQVIALQEAQQHNRQAVRLREAVLEAQRHVAALEAELERLADVYAMIKGDNALKMSFERYLLIEHLEHILHAANSRLNNLSNGQFVLHRSDRLEVRGKQSGLGLDVYDAYTGQYRDVKSLSGGEKFHASLCLALGMSDVIQAHQGGVSIEMMFIDEGFGSLDEESLMKAIAALVDLQRAGRMIGVISHVQELKDAFPAVLEVNKTREGHSKTSIVLK